MSRITQYVLMELLKVFIIALTGMTVIMLLAGLAQEAVRQNLGPGPILKLLPFVLPDALRFAVPGTMLFATCMVFGRMAASNEIVAVKSLGVSPMTVIKPALVLAMVVSCIAVWLNDVAVSWGRSGIHRVVLQSVEEIVYGMLRTNRSFSNKNFAINVKRVEGKTLHRVTMTMHAKGDRPPVIITADEAEFSSDLEHDTLIVYLTRGAIEVGDDALMEFPDTIPYEIPLSDASRRGPAGKGPSDFAWGEIPGEIRAQRKDIEQVEQKLATTAAYQMISGDFTGLLGDEWSGLQTQLRHARERLYRLYTERWRRWANGFSCFFFVLVGAPLAIHFRNADVWSTLGKSFLPILGIYYPLLMFGVDRAKSGDLPPYSVWLGNGILLIVALLLLRKIHRY